MDRYGARLCSRIIFVSALHAYATVIYSDSFCATPLLLRSHFHCCALQYLVSALHTYTMVSLPVAIYIYSAPQLLTLWEAAAARVAAELQEARARKTDGRADKRNPVAYLIPGHEDSLGPVDA